jgi:hypothetical protein
MKFIDFQEVMSIPRMDRYLTAMNGNSRKAMTLYRLNLRLSQVLFTIVSCFEVALRNRIDQHYSAKLGPDWLRDASLRGGMFNTMHCEKTPHIIAEVIRKLNPYCHSKLVSELDFGFWRYTFARHQYNHTYIFSELEKINLLRNRLAHHEPVCFLPGKPIKDTSFSRQRYEIILRLFQWMQINETALLYGIDRVNELSNSIDTQLLLPPRRA